MTAQHPVKTPKKLIEVALPLDAINVAAAREKSIRHGHPSTLHLWWARRPLAAARAVIFGQMVNDPCWKWEMDHPGDIPPNNLKASWAASRKRLFSIIEDLVKWENTTNEEVLERARAEIRKSWRETCELNKDHPAAKELFNPDNLPAFHDPFAGGGALPLEAQRLGLEAYASDLNPVAVLINKAMIEVPTKFAGRPPVNHDARATKDLIARQWKGAEGLAEDVRHYGQWIRDEAQRRIGHQYPPAQVTAEVAKDRPDLGPLIGQQLKVIAWLWARTVKSPNPAFRHVDVPLVSTFILSNREGKDAFVSPVIEGDHYRFDVKRGKATQGAKDGTKVGRGSNFRCLMSGAPISGDYIKSEGKAGRIGSRLLAIVVDSAHGRLYLPPAPEHETMAHNAEPDWAPTTPLPDGALGFSVQLYFKNGTYADLFTKRQLLLLTTLSDLVKEARERVLHDARHAQWSIDRDGLEHGGHGATAYADSVALYLALAVDKAADYDSALVMWSPTRDQVKTTFARNALPMVWDFGEVNPFAEAAGDLSISLGGVVRTIQQLGLARSGHAYQRDAQSQDITLGKVVSTDPPYFDNIGYADLSDFFYAWLRPSLKAVFPELLATISVPKAEELVATPGRHGGRAEAEHFFLNGMTGAMHGLCSQAHSAFPVTIYYAFRQSESDEDQGTSSTGWETFLSATLRAGFSITGTWPIRTEREVRSRGIESNALASSVVLVCRPRPSDATSVSRRVFLRELNQVLPEALDEMTRGAGDEQSPVAPVDLSQAIIGPGMAVFSKYSAVLEADGTPMSVKTALQLINRFLAEDDFDHDTQFCLHWFGQHGWADGKFGDADTLARAKGTSVDGVRQAGVAFAAGGVVRLLKWADYPEDWDPTTDPRLPVWEALHQVIRVFKSEGESAAGVVVAAIQDKAESVRQLAYRLYTLSERAGRAEDARAYNEIITSWSAIESAAATVPTPKQTTLFG